MVLIRTVGNVAVGIGLFLGLLNTAIAQTTPPAAQTPAQAAGSATSATKEPAKAPGVVAVNSASCRAANNAARPIIVKTPAAAAELVQQSLSTSCSCSAAETLSSIQRGLRKSNPAGAKIISEIVAKAPPAFQSCYALALAPTGGDGPGNAGKGGNTGAASISGQGSSTVASAGGIGGTGVGSGAGFGGFGGSGGGTVVSPVHP